MKFTRKEGYEMQEYIKEKLVSLGYNHTYPTEERILSKILCVLADLEVDTK